MCYSLPGPRCSNHAKVALAEATANLATAAENCKNSIESLKDAKSDVDKAEFFAQKKLLAEAKKEVVKAQKTLDVHQEKRAVAIDAYKEKKKEWYATPEGIQELRDDGQHEKADRFEKYRKSQIQQFKRAEEAKEAQKAVNTVMEKPVEKAATKPSEKAAVLSESTPVAPVESSAPILEVEEDNRDVLTGPVEVMRIWNDIRNSDNIPVDGQVESMEELNKIREEIQDEFNVVFVGAALRRYDSLMLEHVEELLNDGSSDEYETEDDEYGEYDDDY